MNYGLSRRHRPVIFIAGLLLMLLIGVAGSPHAATTVSIISPVTGSSVSGSAPIAIATSTAVLSVNVYIDGIYLTSGPPLIIDWNSNSARNGEHTITVTAYGGNNAVVGASSAKVNVNNLLASSSSASGSNTGTVSPNLRQTVSRAIKGVYTKASSVQGRKCPSTLPAHVAGCFFSVKWAQLEPQQGVYDWYAITYQESFDTTNYPLQVEIQVGESGVPNSAAVCNSFTPERGAPACHPWLASAQGINTHFRAGGVTGHEVGGIPPCKPTYDNYPGDAGYQAALAGFETAFHNRFAGDPKITLVSINPMSELGHNLSLPVQIQNVACPDGSRLSETYNAAWNRVAMDHGCSSGDETCWQNLIVNAFQKLWSTQVSILHDMNLSLWVTAYNWPAITGPGQYDGDKDPNGIQQRILTYANAHQPANGGYYVFNEALNAVRFWSKIVGPWITGSPAATGGGAQMLKAFTGAGVGAAGCQTLCEAGILCGAYMGARFQQVYTSDFDTCPSVISQIAQAINGDTTQVCGNDATCP